MTPRRKESNLGRSKSRQLRFFRKGGRRGDLLQKREYCQRDGQQELDRNHEQEIKEEDDGYSSGEGEAAEGAGQPAKGGWPNDPTFPRDGEANTNPQQIFLKALQSLLQNAGGGQ